MVAKCWISPSNIEFATTAAESPWLNGTYEQHNGVINEMIFKIVEGTGCSQ